MSNMFGVAYWQLPNSIIQNRNDGLLAHKNGTRHRGSVALPLATCNLRSVTFSLQRVPYNLQPVMYSL